MAHFIEFQDVYKTYETGEVKTHAVKGASFVIERGELCVVVGRSGAGKTTILNLLGGMDTCTSGRLSVDGEDISGYNQRQLTTYRRHDVGFVFQFYNLVQNLTARENVELAAEICKQPLDAAETLELVGLGHRLQNFPAQLSGGEQQRVAIARALAKNPKLLLCDEPTGALDDETGKQVLQLLYDTCHQSGMTVILITHNASITGIANRIIRVRDGAISDMQIQQNPRKVEEIEW